jgi:ATP synthase protein I
MARWMTVKADGAMGGDHGEGWRAAAALSTIGMVMALSVFVGFGLGYALDRWLRTLPWLTVAGAILGVVAGFRETIRLIRRFSGDA